MGFVFYELSLVALCQSVMAGASWWRLCRCTCGSELKRELKDYRVFYLSARGEIVAPHIVEVHTHTTSIAKELGRCVGR